MKITELEQLRLEARNSILCGIGITLCLAFVFFIIGLFPVVIFGSIIGVIVTAILSNKKIKRFKYAFKKVFVVQSLEKTFDDLVYFSDRGLDESIIKNTKMMNMGDRYSSNDYIEGKYKNIKVIQSDIHIEREDSSTDANGHTTTSWVTIFRGRWMIFDFNKIFKANLQIRQKWFGNARISNWGEKIKYKKVKVEDQSFNKQFTIYAQSEHEAFYILTPSFMEKIKRLIYEIDGKVMLCFIDKKLHVAVDNNKDSFEHGIFTKIDEQRILDKINHDINLITSFVDELDLDNDLFKREDS